MKTIYTNSVPRLDGGIMLELGFEWNNKTFRWQKSVKMNQNLNIDDVKVIKAKFPNSSIYECGEKFNLRIDLREQYVR